MSDAVSNSDEETSFSDLAIIASEPTLSECSAIVAIGASAGGLEAFTQILKNLPIDTGMGFVLIQHLAPQHNSQLSEILRRSTEMPVNEAREGVRIMPNSVYVIPPNTSMTLEQGVLRLEPRQRIKGKYMVIDEFFSSLAADRKEQAIAVILSGSNEDGTAGLGAIKVAGGITFAQDIASAEFPTMPMIAIASGYVDYVLSPAEIAAELVNISKNGNDGAMNTAITLYEPDEQSALVFIETVESITALSTIFELLLNATGADFCHYKKGTIRRRMVRRMGLLGLQKLEDYVTYLQEHSSEIGKLYNDLLINVTSFFRDPESFKSLQKLVFPIICQNKSHSSPIRIWVAGCATGEEVYSIAISLLEFLDDYPIKPAIQIFATDISEQAIETARAGVYHQNLLTDISPERLRRFFTPADGGYQISKLVRELCIFARQNLTSDPPFSRLDLISCRNMLIYLEPVLQKKVMPIFHYALNTSGFLMLGSSEGIGNAGDLFAIADKKNRIYKSKITSSRMNFNFIKSNQMSEIVNREKRNEISTETNLELLADQVILSRYAPAGVVINSELEILQFRGQTSPYLDPAPGKASLNLLKMARVELRLDLRSAIYNARDKDLPITKDGVEMSKGVLVKLDVIPLRVNEDQCFLVLFESRPAPILLTPAAVNSLAKPRKERATKTDTDMEVVRLTHELEKTKEYLRSIIDTQEANNQDLKVAGEEILSSNEELQSTNEELETAKEEIQATNEELGTINDELRSRNIQLHLVNNDMQNLLSSVNIAILMLSGDLRIRRFTPMAEQSFNLIPSDVGRPFSDIQINLDILHIRDLVTSVIDTLIPYEQDVQDHSGNWFSLRIRPYRTTDNHIDGVVISLFDIDQLKRNAIELGASRNYATSIIETLHQPLVVLDADLQVITANRAFYQIFQMHPHQTEQQSIFALGDGDWNIPKLRSLLNDILLLDISVQDYEVTQNFAHLGTRTMMLNACRIEQGNVGQMILIAIEDITERNLQKQQLVTKNQELSEAMFAFERANLAKSVFLGNMSHELRTPLNAIMGFAQILLDRPNLDAESQEYLGIILQSGEHLLSLIEDLLDISRIEANKIEIVPNLLSLSNFLEVTLAIVYFKAMEKNLTLTTQFAPDLPETIYADEKRLRQVLLNLLSNAIKFTDTGAITFSVTLSQSTSSDPLIQFAIADTGVGMTAAEMEKIFLPFEQAGKAEARTQGTGLGLAISQNLVQKMGGEINVVSTVNVGSTFSFELDLIANQPQALISPATEAIALLPPTTENAAIAVQEKATSTKPLSILIVEDVDYNQVLLKLVLENLGHEADIANNGLEAIEMLRKKNYDIILMDVQMPVLDGIEATKRIIAEWDQASRPYIIAVSANVAPEDQKQYIAAGMDAYISKPIDFALLKKALLRV
jgi:two-component system, chemotaxis family, CheB/CheR fusion protein